MQVQTRGVRTGFSELAVLQNGAHFEIGTGLAATQAASAKINFAGGKLKAGSEGVPMHLLLGGP